MKVTKLIIPLLGLTSINNANKQELLQIEKMPEVSYEFSVNDKWDNYLVNDNKTWEFNTKQIKEPIQEPTGLVCADILEAANACWNDWNLVRVTACYASAMALYAACIAATSF